MNSRNTRKPLHGLAPFIAGLLLSSCAPPQYDAQTDQQITTLQIDTDTLLIHLISLDDQIINLKNKQDGVSQSNLAADKTAAEYNANLASYNKMAVDFTTLKTRIDLEPDKSTPHLDEALNDIDQNLFGSQSLQSQHESEDTLSATYLQAELGILDLQFSTLLSYELILKAGGTTAKTG